MTVPRLRSDLEASATDDEGLTFYDVVDPRSGTSMRLYEHEWLIARRMDGTASLDEIATWAGGALPFAPSALDLQGYAKKLGELGFFDAEGASSSDDALPDETDFGALDDTTATIDVRNDVLLAVRRSQYSKDPRQAAHAVDDAATAIPARPLHDFEEPTRPQYRPTLLDEAHETLASHRAEDDASSDDVLADVRLPAAAPTSAAPPAVEASAHGAHHSDGADAHDTLETDDTGDTVRDRLFAVPALLVDGTPAAAPGTEAVAPHSPVPARTADHTLRPVGTTTPTRHTPTTPQPVADRKEAALPRTPSRAGLVALAILGAIIVAGVLAYTFILPSLRTTIVSVQAVGAPADRVEFFDGKGVVMKPAPQTLAFADSGRVVDVVGVSVETKPGMTLASLDTYAAMEKELADVRDRAAFYENALRVALEKKRTVDAKKAQQKIDEKKKRQVLLEERIAKARIIASTAATVTEVLVTAGADVEAGAPALRVADRRILIDAKLTPADARRVRVGQVVQVMPINGSAIGQARVTAVDVDTVKLEVTDDAAGTIANGTQVQLVSRRLTNVTRVPLAALTRSQGGGDQVFVLVGTEVRARLVTVAQTTAADVYLSAGLVAGDRVIVNPTPDLADGQKAATE